VKKSNYTGSQGTVELKLMRELTWRQSSQSKKAEIVNYYYQWQILKPRGKRKAKRIFTVSVKTPKRQRRKQLQKVLQEWLISMVPPDKNEPSCHFVNKPYESRPIQS
jgi:hypothetical protein